MKIYCFLIYFIVFSLLSGCNKENKLSGNPIPCERDSDCIDSDPCSIDYCNLEKKRCYHRLGCIKEVCSHSYYTCAITYSGKLKCWGSNNMGALGNGDWRSSEIPVDVIGLNGPVKQVSCGLEMACCIINGGVKFWEDGSSSHNVPEDVEGLTSGITYVSCNEGICAITESGGLKCPAHYPTYHYKDFGLTSNVVSITLFPLHICALMNSGELKCWGNNDYGQLGIGEAEYFTTHIPQTVTSLGNDVKGICKGGYYHTCAILKSGGLKCWGANYWGQLGDGTTTNRFTPVDVYGITSEVEKVSCGVDFSCALLADGKVKCWGRNNYGQLGNGTLEQSLIPVDVIGIDKKVVDLASGASHSIVVLESGEVMYWGSGHPIYLDTDFESGPVTIPSYVLSSK